MPENPLTSITLLSAEAPLYAYIGERYLTRYKTPVGGRLGMPGLRQRVATEAHSPNASTGF